MSAAFAGRGSCTVAAFVCDADSALSVDVSGRISPSSIRVTVSVWAEALVTIWTKFSAWSYPCVASRGDFPLGFAVHCF